MENSKNTKIDYVQITIYIYTFIIFNYAYYTFINSLPNESEAGERANEPTEPNQTSGWNGVAESNKHTTRTSLSL